MLIYSVCYYYGKNKLGNLDNHLQQFKKITDDKIFIIDVMIDSKDIEYHNKVQIELSNYIDLTNSCGNLKLGFKNTKDTNEFCKIDFPNRCFNDAIQGYLDLNKIL